MKKVGQIVCCFYKQIIVLCLISVIPALIGMYKTRINYDILVYLPDDIETIKGEKILTSDFNMGAYAVLVVNNMASKDVLKLEDKIKNIEGVNKVVGVSDVTGNAIPLDILPSSIKDKVAKDNSQLVLVTFNHSTSDDETLKAVEDIRKMVNKQTKVGGMSTMVLDTKELFNSEMTLYILVAVIFCIIVLLFALDSYVVPFLLIINIGIAILYNMGTNIFFGDISYITKAISAVLQLGVTTDFSIFLYHKYGVAKKKISSKKEAMADAINATLVAVLGSSMTTIAGFLALCTMNLKLGMDIGLVMAKGVVFGLLCVITLFPSLLLLFDKQIDKTKHRQLIPQFKLIKNFVLKHYRLIFIVFLILLIPFYQAQRKTENYYKLDESIPDNYGYVQATKVLKEDYGIVSQEIILVSKSLSDVDTNMMIEDIKKVKGINLVLSGSMLTKLGIDETVLSDEVKNIYQSDKYELILINSSYDIATDELNSQIMQVEHIVSKYDQKAIVAGEGPLMKDLVEITDTDFKNVNVTSIIVIFFLMMLVLKSISLPVLLVSAIELAIFINLGIPYFMGIKIPFIASVVIGTIQLGATIDYAILMTTKYLEQRKIKPKMEAVQIALDHSVSSIFVSGMCFFAATVSVSIVSKIDLIGSLCTLISRGAIISMIVVMTIVPAMLIIFDKIIIKTTLGFKKGRRSMKKLSKLAIILLVLSILAFPVSALTKEETVYVKITNGKTNVSVVEHLSNLPKGKIKDRTNLKNIENISGKEKFSLEGDRITFENKKQDIYYKGTTDKELPIDLDISYKLNDKEVKLSKILGQKGHVEIKLHYQNKEKHSVNIDGVDTTLYTPFVVGLTTIFDGTKVSNVTIDNGKVISNGQNYIIAGLATPGLYESLGIDELSSMDTITIGFDTTSFEMPTVYSAISSKVVDSIDLNYLTNIDNIYTGINTLSTSSKKLVDGAKTLNEGVEKINNGVSQAVDNLRNNKQTIDDNTLTIISDSASSNAVKTIEECQDTIMNEAIQKVVEVENSTHQIKQSSDYGIDNNAILIDALKLETHKQMNLSEESVMQKYEACENGSIDYCNQVATIEGYEQATINQAKEGFYQSALELTKQTAANTAYNTALQIAEKTASETSKVVAINVFTQVKESIISKVVISLDELQNGLDQLHQGTDALKQGMEQFDKSGIATIYDLVYKRLKPSVSKVKALKQLASDYKTYTKVGDGVEASTKFIYVVDGTKPSQKDQIINTKKDTKSSFITRIKDLFK